LDLEGGDGHYSTSISAAWDLAVVPQGGAIAAAAVRAMAAELAEPTQTLRTMTAMFAGKVTNGPVEITVRVLRRGRSMSQLTADVRNPGTEAGLTAVAAFGALRRGFEFTELVMPDVARPDDVRGFRDPLPDGVVFEFDHEPRPFWDSIVEGRPVIGRAPWEPFEEGPAEVATWYRFDQPPLDADGRLDVVGPVVLCDTMPGSVGQKLGPQSGSWFAPSVDYTLHLFGSARPGWLLAHQRARHAGDGYASVDTALWDPTGPSLVAYATQVMVFAFDR
jgi:acyl-CoA thioesterase